MDFYIFFNDLKLPGCKVLLIDKYVSGDVKFAQIHTHAVSMFDGEKLCFIGFSPRINYLAQIAMRQMYLQGKILIHV